MKNLFRLPLLFLVAFIFSTPAFSSCTGSSPSWTASNDYASVNTCYNNSVAGDTIHILAGETTWTQAVSVTKNISIIGAGQGVTIIDGTPFVISGTQATGNTVSFRLSGMTINLNGGRIDISDATNFRIDHLTVVQPSAQGCFMTYASTGIIITGLYDHIDATYCQFEEWNDGYPYTSNAPNLSYAATTPLISSNQAVYFEDSSFTNPDPSSEGYFNCWDSINAGRYVIRFNSMDGCRVEAHGLQADNQRAVRWWEVYQNRIVNSNANKGYWPFSMRGGTGMIHHNTLDANWSQAYARLDTDRAEESSIADSGQIPLWQMCDGTTQSTYVNDTLNTFSISSNVVTINFSSLTGGGLSVGSVVTYQLLTTGTYLNGVPLTVTSLTTSGSPYYTQEGFTANFTHANVGSTADYGVGYLTFGSSKSLLVDGAGTYGRLCRDQIGAGRDVTTWLNRFSTTPPAQTLEPAYIWNNPMGGTEMPVNVSCETAGSIFCAYEVANIAQNSEYYLYQTSGCTGTQTTGVCEGTLANRASNCTAGVGYWATDQGSWNVSGNGRGQGQLYKCTGNAWVLYYAPYTYPHPLTVGSTPSAQVGNPVESLTAATSFVSATKLGPKQGNCPVNLTTTATVGATHPARACKP